LKPPFHKQEKPHTCAVACLRMVLDLHGLAINEEVLSEKCQTTTLGTSADDVVQAARELGFPARKEHATFDDLRRYLSSNIFPILFINLLVIDGYNTTHAVVVEEVSDNEIKVLDPRLGNLP
jgi:ABC-type bacteriocin/lantibiotic exporter with double-glycine peptidase domain